MDESWAVPGSGAPTSDLRSALPGSASPWFASPKLAEAVASATTLASQALLHQDAASLDLAFGAGASSRIEEWLLRSGGEDSSRLLASLGVKIGIVDGGGGFCSGAYSPFLNTIFLSDSLVNGHSEAALTGVLVEELGHAIDATINACDTAGDEGQIFAALAAGEGSRDIQAAAFGEDDSGFLAIAGERIAVEFSNSITVYEHANFQGRSKSFGIGNYGYIGNAFNDLVTSVRIPRGSELVVEAFQDPNFKGRSTVLSYSQASIGADWNDPNWRVSHLNDTVSSLKVRYRRPDEIIFYQHANFQGLAHSDPTGSRRNVRFDNDYSSIDLPRNARLTAFEHSAFRGAKATYSDDVAFVGGLNDKISSYIAYRPNNPVEVFVSLYDRAVAASGSDRALISKVMAAYGVLAGNRDIKALATLTGLKPNDIISRFQADPVEGSLLLGSLIPGKVGLGLKVLLVTYQLLGSITKPIIETSLENINRRNAILKEVSTW